MYENDDDYDERDMLISDDELDVNENHLNIVRDIAVFALGRPTPKNTSGYNYIFFPQFLGAKMTDEDASECMFRGMQHLEPDNFDTEEAFESFIKQLPVEDGSPRVEYELRKHFDIPYDMKEMTLFYTMTNSCILAPQDNFEKLFDLNKNAGLWFNHHPFDDTFHLVDSLDTSKFQNGQNLQALMYIFVGRYGKFKKMKLYRVLHDVTIGVIENKQTGVKSVYPKSCRLVTDFTKKENIKEIVNELNQYVSNKDSCN